MDDESKYETLFMPADGTGESYSLRIPKQVAEITLCGALHFAIMDYESFVRPTEEQIKNLHDILCIDVKLFDEE